MTSHARTPLDDPSGRLWVDSSSWDVRLGAHRGKIVVADVAPDAILWSVGSEYRLSERGVQTSVAFELRHGLAEGLHDAPQPGWMNVIHELIPPSVRLYDGPWSRVGLREGTMTYDFSVPTGSHVDAAQRLGSAGLTIVRVRMIRADADQVAALDTCA